MTVEFFPPCGELWMCVVENGEKVAEKCPEDEKDGVGFW